MQRHTQTTLDTLQVGNTFERIGGDIIYEVLDTPRLVRSVRYVRKGTLKLTDMLPLKTEVVFLKHADKKA